MVQRILGIDLGSYSVKIAEVTRSFKAFEFVGFYERRIQYNELLSPEESTAIALQGLLDDHHLQGDLVYTAISGRSYSARLLSFPFSSSKRLTQAVQFEIETFVPFEVSDLVVDHGVLVSSKELTKVLAVYAQKKDIERIITLLSHVKLEPRIIAAEGIDVVGLMNLGLVPPEGNYAILDIGHEKTNVMICKGRRIAFVRSLSIAGKQLTQAIADKLGVPFDEAERMKIEMGHVPFADEEVDDITSGVVAAIQEVMHEFLLHVRQTFFAFRNDEGEAVEALYICGGTSRLPGIDRLISDALKLNVTYLNCTDFHFTHIKHPDAHRHIIPQALSLALRGIAASGAPRINFRQGEFAFKGDVEEFGGGMKWVVAALILIVVLGITSFTMSYYTLRGRLDKVQKDITEVMKQAMPDAPAAAFKTSKAALSLLMSKEQEMQTRKTALEALSTSSPLEMLREISAQVPARGEIRLDVDKVSIAAGKVSLGGATDSFEAVDRVKESIEKSELFQNVVIGNRSKGTQGEVKFMLSFEIKKPEEEQPAPVAAPSKLGGK